MIKVAAVAPLGARRHGHAFQATGTQQHLVSRPHNGRPRSSLSGPSTFLGRRSRSHRRPERRGETRDFCCRAGLAPIRHFLFPIEQQPTPSHLCFAPLQGFSRNADTERHNHPCNRHHAAHRTTTPVHSGSVRPRDYSPPPSCLLCKPHRLPRRRSPTHAPCVNPLENGPLQPLTAPGLPPLMFLPLPLPPSTMHGSRLHLYTCKRQAVPTKSVSESPSFRSKGELLDSRNGTWCRVPSGYVTPTSRLLRHGLRYVPYRNQLGTDTFKFQALDINEGRESRDAVATIAIERAGLQWQILTTASTGLSAGPSADASGTIGASATDALFRLDWQWHSPRSTAPHRRRGRQAGHHRIF